MKEVETGIINGLKQAVAYEQGIKTMEPKYETTETAIFHYSAPTQDNKAKFEELTALWITVAETIDRLCPVSREKSLAITHLDECRFFANGAIVRRS